MIWNESKECMSRDEMHALQSARLVKWWSVCITMCLFTGKNAGNGVGIRRCQGY